MFWQMLTQMLTQTWQTFINLLYKKTILVLTILCTLGIVGTIWNFSALSHNIMKIQALESAKSYAQALEEARTLYSSRVVPQARASGMSITHDYAIQDHGIPLPATYLIELGETISENNPGMSVRLYSRYPFPWRVANGGARDDFEKQAMDYLEKNPQGKFVRAEKYDGRQSFRYAQADLLKPSCIECHNNHPYSPKRDWRIGDVRGVLEITQPMDAITRQVNQGLQGTTIVLTGLAMAAISGLAIVIGKLRNTSRELELKVRERTWQLSEAKEKSENLLLNILPEAIADRLKDGHKEIADGFAVVTILFADIVGFTPLSESVSPTELVHLLNLLFSRFDHLSDRYNLEKIKTIGDAYMVAGGIPNPSDDHAEAIAAMALEMLKEIAEFNIENQTELNLRIGINSGPVTAGVIGKKKFIYDLWGDAVNTASRMESHGLPGVIQVTESTYNLLKDQYNFVERGTIHIKGKGNMLTYLLTGRKGETTYQAINNYSI